MPTQTQDYKQLLTDVIKKQIVILGPDITLSKARNVKGLTIADDGTVTNVEGSPQEIIQALIDQFVQLSGLIVKKTMEPLLMATQQVSDGEVSQTSPLVSPAPTPIPTPAATPTAPIAPPVSPATAQPVVTAPTQPETQAVLPVSPTAQTVAQSPSVQPASTQPVPSIAAPAEQLPAAPTSPLPVQAPLSSSPASVTPVAPTQPAAQPTTPQQPTAAQPANNPLAA